MAVLLDRRVPHEDWLQEVSQVNGLTPANLRRPVHRPDQMDPAQAERWEKVIDEVVAMQHLGVNWDGLYASAPSLELLASVVGLAYLLKDDGVDAPSRAVPSTSGTVLLEWQFADGSYGEIEVTRPLFAECMLLEPGKPAKHWTFPSE